MYQGMLVFKNPKGIFAQTKKPANLCLPHKTNFVKYRGFSCGMSFSE